jgi:hypothetical protein
MWNRDWRQLRGELDRAESRNDFLTKPYLGQIRGYDSSQDKIKVAGPTGEPTIPLSHPFISANAWIRAIPENNSSVWLHSRQDNQRLGMLGYSNDVLGNRVSDFNTGLGVYRELKPGEIEINSYGIAGLYARRDGTLEIRGGLVYGEYSHPRLEHWVRAPLHNRRLVLNEDNQIGDEERYGAIRRYRDEKAANPTSIKNEDGTIRKEYYRDLKWVPKGSKSSKFLVRMQEGDVVDEKSSQKTQDVTELNLRFLKEFYTKNGTSNLSIQVDENGNYYVSLPNEAETGGQMTIPAGAFLAQIAKDMEFQIQKSFKVMAANNNEQTSLRDTKLTAIGNFDIDTLRNLTMSVGLVMSATAKILAEIKAPIVKLGNGSLSGVITHNYYPFDFVTGWPIPYSPFVSSS